MESKWELFLVAKDLLELLERAVEEIESLNGWDTDLSLEIRDKITAVNNNLEEINSF